MEMTGLANFLSLSALIIVLFLFTMAIKVVKQYEKAVILRFGRFIGVRGAGLIFALPIIDKVLKIDMRVSPMDVPRQEILTKDNVSAVVDAVLYYKVEDPAKAILEVNNYMEAIFLIAQTTLRSVLGQMELDGILSERGDVNKHLHEILDEQARNWGLNVIMVELKELVLPEEMKRAMARQAEVERERRALVISADGEYQASQKLRQAAEIIGKEPAALQLRYLQTLSDISVGKTSTIVFPVPINIFEKLFDKRETNDRENN